MEAEIILAMREANGAADMVTKIGINQGEDNIRVIVPPADRDPS